MRQFGILIIFLLFYQACGSSINNTSADYGLLLPNDSYAFTAKSCVKCSCSSGSYILLSGIKQWHLSCCSYISNGLDCYLASSNGTCPVAKCSGNLTLGESTGTGCDAITCAYGDYTNTPFQILTTSATNQSSSCKSAAARHTGPTGSAWMKLVVLLHLIFISICFL